MERPADLADFTYRELCFAIDHFYGLPGRCVLNDAVAEKGLDLALTEYGPAGEETKRLIKSTDMGEYLAGMNYLNYFFYDGGHTFIIPGYLGESMMSEELQRDTRRSERSTVSSRRCIRAQRRILLPCMNKTAPKNC